MYTNWYFRLGTLCERNSMRIRPLDGTEASALEIGSDRYASRLRAVSNRPQSGPLPSTGNEHDGNELTPRTRVVLS